MFLKFVFIASLAIGVLGRTTFDNFDIDKYDPYDEYSQIVATAYCTATHAEDKTPQVKATIKTFVKCMKSLFDLDVLAQEVREAKPSGAYDIIFKKYCTKAPELKACASDLVTGVTPCLPPGMTGTSIKSTNTLIDFVCDNDAARVSRFVNEGGPQCIQQKQLDFSLCQQETTANTTRIAGEHGSGLAGALALSVEEKCAINRQSMSCFVNVLKTCPNPGPAQMAQQLRDVYLESMSCPEVSLASVQVPQGLSTSPVTHDAEDLKIKKLELEVRIAELEMWNRENELNVKHTDLTSDIKQN